MLLFGLNLTLLGDALIVIGLALLISVLGVCVTVKLFNVFLGDR